MDVYKALRELHEEKARLDSAITALEARVKTTSGKTNAQTRRGRRSMSAEEREEVSKRMSRYWASRRNKGQLATTAGGATNEANPANSQAIREVA